MSEWSDEEAFTALAERLRRRGLDVERVITEGCRLQIETPSWGYGDSGTRFKVFSWPGAARTIEEKLADAALVHRLTGVCPGFAIHIPWDRVSDWDGLRRRAEELGLRIGSVNPNLFQDDDYRLGSLCHPAPDVRRKALEHVVECVAIAREVGSTTLSLWLADGTNYPGQDSIRDRKRRLEETLREVYARLPEEMRLLIEYKLFEPAFYHTDLADWGVAHAVAVKLGPRAQVLVDVGHHALGTNVEHIVAFLLDEGRLGGFHLNGRKYADDDLIVGSINPFELFLVFTELRWAIEDPRTEPHARRVAYVLDQSHNVEPKVEAMVQSVVNVQAAHARAWLVDGDRLRRAQREGDVLEAHRTLLEAYETDVRPLVAEVRRRLGAEPDPVAAYRASGHQQRVARERATAAPGHRGYPGA
ncbi:MAG TPA: L-rhamnose isomerase [Candidatus Dormibacteraeota bacterium]|nr:L-rhamnose isomerase [Candidatus Dormibacteraeota bacterium]